MALTEQEARFIETFRKLAPAARYAVAYVIDNIKEITSEEEVYAIGNQKIAEYNAGVIDERYARVAKAV